MSKKYMKIMNIYKYLLGIVILFILVFSGIINSMDFDIHGIIESKRKDDITVLFDKKPMDKEYYIINEKEIIGTIHIITVIYNRTGKQKYRAIVQYTLHNKNHEKHIRIGYEIALIKKKGAFIDSSKTTYKDSIDLKKRIISIIDKREMILIPAGKFIFGSNSGDKDEFPEQVVYLKDFYIDTYEVSNKQYKTFVEETNAPPPLSWKKGTFNDEENDLPVLVTYYEALSYAKWTKKRLPTEQEWEKAARGIGNIDKEANKKNNIYPWGNKFISDKVNSIEFWSDNKSNNQIKKMYHSDKPCLLPISLFEAGASPYGIINMSGNAREWTSSWYMLYKGNTNKNKKYGKQYKVIRGGAWYNDRYRVRATSREIGGLPNLYKDNTAGFRCVMDIKFFDNEIE